MARRLVVLDGESILALLVHYTDGAVPIDAQLRSAGISRAFQRWLGLEVTSDQWNAPRGANAQDGGLYPLHVRYDGKKVMSWGDKQAPIEWTDAPDAPGRQ